MKKHEIGDLNQLYTDGESADYEVFCEMRSNILLQSSEHYKKVRENLLQRLENSRTSEALKLKLVKNHIQVVTKTYINNIIANAPGVAVVPFNEKELQDQKEAELSQAVWADAEEKLNYREKIERWAESFVVVGEMASKTYWNPNAGKFIGYRQKTDKMGQPLFDPTTGQPAPDNEQPVFQGQLIQEPVMPYNIIRKKGVHSLEESPFLCIRNMLPIGDVKAMVAGIADEKEREEKEAFIIEASETPFKVFDAQTGNYDESKDQVLLKEYYFKPCAEYPQGYYYITTEKGILFEGELPFGEFPIITEGFDFVPTSPRARSIIKPLRGPQAEINRMASMRSTTQITLGQDMMILQAGSKLAKGSNFAGVREFTVSGPPPTVIQGRSGDQFAASLAEEINDLYKLANLEYEMAENQVQDPNLQLYRSLSQRKKYSMYVTKFERFLCRNAKLYLKLAKRYLPDDYLVKAVGKRDSVNLAEFKRIDDEGFNIKLKPMSEDIDSMFGQHLSVQTALQYGSSDMPMSVKARLIEAMPFLKADRITSKLTLTDENIENDILALDRGEFRPATPNDDHPEYIAQFTHRTKQADFKLLPPQVQQMYQVRIQQHEQMQAQQEQMKKLFESEMIPTGGALVTCSIHVPDPQKPGESRQLRLPYDALMDLVKRLEAQGTTLDSLQTMDQQQQMQVIQAAHQMNQQQQMPPAQPQAAGPGMLPMHG